MDALLSQDVMSSSVHCRCDVDLDCHETSVTWARVSGRLLFVRNGRASETHPARGPHSALYFGPYLHVHFRQN